MEKGFTLIIPLYNKEKSIQKTLDSVLYNHGTYPFKCLIIDDDSIDGGSEIAIHYDKHYPNIFQYFKIVHHGNKTPVNARNFGIKLCDTEYIGFLDADDELCAGFIDRGCEFLDAHPEYSMYSNGHKLCYLDSDGEYKYTERNYSFNEVNKFTDYLWANAHNVHFCSSIYKTELVKDCLFTDVFCEDVVFKMKYMYKNPSLYLDNSTCESIIWNTYYSNSYEWNHQKTNVNYIEEVLNTLNEEIPELNLKFYIENDQIWLINN